MPWKSAQARDRSATGTRPWTERRSRGDRTAGAIRHLSNTRFCLGQRSHPTLAPGRDRPDKEPSTIHPQDGTWQRINHCSRLNRCSRHNQCGRHNQCSRCLVCGHCRLGLVPAAGVLLDRAATLTELRLFRIGDTPPPAAIGEAGWAGIVGPWQLQRPIAPVQHHIRTGHRASAAVGHAGRIDRTGEDLGKQKVASTAIVINTKGSGSHGPDRQRQDQQQRQQ